MAVVTVSGQAWGLATDSRWRKWGKRINGLGQVDLSKSNGYSLTGEFVRWGESVALHPGQYLVLAAESGSAKYHEYSYRLIGVDADDQPIDLTEQVDQVLVGAFESPVPVADEHRARAKNSWLYSAALYIWLTAQTAPVAGSVSRDADSPIEIARRALAALTPEERVRLLTEVL